MNAPASKGPTVDCGKCRFCGNMKKCRVADHPYDYMGNREVYADMLYECFNVLLQPSRASRLVCAACVVRLRAARCFRQQVLRCERDLLHLEQLEHEAVFTGESSKRTDIDVKLETNPDTEEMSAQASEEDYRTSDGDDAAGDDDLKDEQDCEEPPTLILAPDSRPPRLQPRPRPRARPRPRPRPVRAAGGGTRAVYRDMRTRTAAQTRALLLARMQRAREQPRVAIAAAPLRSSGRERAQHDNTLTLIKHSHITPFHNNQGAYYCHYCRDSFTDPRDLRDHTGAHDPNTYDRHNHRGRVPTVDITRIDCRLCPANISDITHLKIHLTETHGVKIYNVPDEMILFKLTHPSIACLECGQSYMFIDKLMEHTAEHFGRHVCDKCGAAFVQPKTLAAHLRCHNKPTELFPCHVCGKKLSTNRSRFIHVSVVHEKKPVFDCLKCDEKFMSYSYRNKHMVEAHGQNRSYPCHACGVTFDLRKKLVMHDRAVHRKEYTHQCEMCDKKYSSPDQVKRHMKKYHKE